jgi:hypothetical protein
MKLSALILALLAVAVAVVPFFFNCQHDGKMIALASGTQIPMKCYWTAQAELALSIPLLGVAGMLAFSRRRESRRVLAVLGAILGGLVILLPTRLIGVCSHPDASCSLVMKPAMILTGALLMGVNLLSLAVPERGRAYGREVPAVARAEAEQTNRTAGL